MPQILFEGACNVARNKVSYCSGDAQGLEFGEVFMSLCRQKR